MVSEVLVSGSWKCPVLFLHDIILNSCQEQVEEYTPEAWHIPDTPKEALHATQSEVQLQSLYLISSCTA